MANKSGSEKGEGKAEAPAKKSEAAGAAKETAAKIHEEISPPPPKSPEAKSQAGTSVDADKERGGGDGKPAGSQEQANAQAREAERTREREREQERERARDAERERESARARERERQSRPDTSDRTERPASGDGQPKPRGDLFNALEFLGLKSVHGETGERPASSLSARKQEGPDSGIFSAIKDMARGEMTRLLTSLEEAAGRDSAPAGTGEAENGEPGKRPDRMDAGDRKAAGIEEYTDEQSGAFYRYDSEGRISRIDHPEGTTSTFTYNPETGQLAGLKIEQSGSTTTSLEPGSGDVVTINQSTGEVTVVTTSGDTTSQIRSQETTYGTDGEITVINSDGKGHILSRDIFGPEGARERQQFTYLDSDGKPTSNPEKIDSSKPVAAQTTDREGRVTERLVFASADAAEKNEPSHREKIDYRKDSAAGREAETHSFFAGGDDTGEPLSVIERATDSRSGEITITASTGTDSKEVLRLAADGKPLEYTVSSGDSELEATFENGSLKSIRRDGGEAEGRQAAALEVHVLSAVRELTDRYGSRQPGKLEIERGDVGPTGPGKGSRPTGTLVWTDESGIHQAEVDAGVVSLNGRAIGTMNDAGEITPTGQPGGGRPELPSGRISDMEGASFSGVGSDHRRLALVSDADRESQLFCGVLESPDGSERVSVLNGDMFDGTGRFIGRMDRSGKITFEPGAGDPQSVSSRYADWRFTGFEGEHERRFTAGDASASGSFVTRDASGREIKYEVRLGMIINSETGEMFGTINPPVYRDGKLEGGSVVIAGSDPKSEIPLANFTGAVFELRLDSQSDTVFKGLAMGPQEMTPNGFKPGVGGLLDIHGELHRQKTRLAQVGQMESDLQHQKLTSLTYFKEYWKEKFGIETPQDMERWLSQQQQDSTKIQHELNRILIEGHASPEKIAELQRLISQSRIHETGDPLLTQKDKLDANSRELESLPDDPGRISGSAVMNIPDENGQMTPRSFRIEGGSLVDENGQPRMRIDAREGTLTMLDPATGAVLVDPESGAARVIKMSDLTGAVWNLEYSDDSGQGQSAQWISLGPGQGIESVANVRNKAHQESTYAQMLDNQSQTSESAAALARTRTLEGRYNQALEQMLASGQPLSEEDLKMIVEGPRRHVRAEALRESEPPRPHQIEIVDLTAENVEKTSGIMRIGQDVYEIREGALYRVRYDGNGNASTETRSSGNLKPGYIVEIEGRPPISLAETNDVLMRFTIEGDSKEHRIIGLGPRRITDGGRQAGGGLVDADQLMKESIEFQKQAEAGNEEYFRNRPVVTGGLTNYLAQDPESVLQQQVESIEHHRRGLKQEIDLIFSEGFNSSRFANPRVEQTIRATEQMMENCRTTAADSKALAASTGQLQDQASEAAATVAVSFVTMGVGALLSTGKAAATLQGLSTVTRATVHVGSVAVSGATVSTVMRHREGDTGAAALRNAGAGVFESTSFMLGGRFSSLASELKLAADASRLVKLAKGAALVTGMGTDAFVQASLNDFASVFRDRSGQMSIGDEKQLKRIMGGAASGLGEMLVASALFKPLAGKLDDMSMREQIKQGVQPPALKSSFGEGFEKISDFGAAACTSYYDGRQQAIEMERRRVAEELGLRNPDMVTNELLSQRINWAFVEAEALQQAAQGGLLEVGASMGPWRPGGTRPPGSGSDAGKSESTGSGSTPGTAGDSGPSSIRLDQGAALPAESKGSTQEARLEPGAGEGQPRPEAGAGSVTLDNGRVTRIERQDGSSTSFEYRAGKDGSAEVSRMVEESTAGTRVWTKGEGNSWKVSVPSEQSFIQKLFGQGATVNAEISASADGTLTISDSRGKATYRSDGSSEIREHSGGLRLYSASGQLSETVSATGQHSRFEYGADGHLAFVSVSMDGKQWTRSEAASSLADGSERKLEVLADGTLRETIKSADGQTCSVEHRLDGSRERTEANGWKVLEGATYETERSRIRSVLESSVSDPALLARMKTSLEILEEKAHFGEIDKEELARVYNLLARMIEADPPCALSKAERIRIASDVLAQAGFPHFTNQGSNPTCNVATIEARMYMRSPSSVVRILHDAATAGVFTTADGNRVELARPGENNGPEAKSGRDEQWEKARKHVVRVESGEWHPDARSYASQIFQKMAVNAKWVTDSVSPYNKPVAPGSIRYDGTYMVDLTSGSPVRITNEAGRPERSPCLYAADIAKLYERLTGDGGSRFVICHKEYAGESTVQALTSPEDLRSTLEQLKEQADREGKPFCATIVIHCAHEPFYRDSGQGAAGGAGGGHVVNITGFAVETLADGREQVLVSVDNQWGKETDHIFQKIPLQDLYRATLPPASLDNQESIRALQTLVDENPGDLTHRLELLRGMNEMRMLTEKELRESSPGQARRAELESLAGRFALTGADFENQLKEIVRLAKSGGQCGEPERSYVIEQATRLLANSRRGDYVYKPSPPAEGSLRVQTSPGSGRYDPDQAARLGEQQRQQESEWTSDRADSTFNILDTDIAAGSRLPASERPDDKSGEHQHETAGESQTIGADERGGFAADNGEESHEERIRRMFADFLNLSEPERIQLLAEMQKILCLPGGDAASDWNAPASPDGAGRYNLEAMADSALRQQARSELADRATVEKFCRELSQLMENWAALPEALIRKERQTARAVEAAREDLEAAVRPLAPNLARKLREYRFTGSDPAELRAVFNRLIEREPQLGPLYERFTALRRQQGEDLRQLQQIIRSRADGLEEIVNRIASDNNLPPVTVRASAALPERAHGRYGRGTGDLLVDLDLLGHPENIAGAARTLLHEFLHSEQDGLLVRLYAGELGVSHGASPVELAALSEHYKERTGVPLRQDYMLRVLAASKDLPPLTSEQAARAAEFEHRAMDTTAKGKLEADLRIVVNRFQKLSTSDGPEDFLYELFLVPSGNEKQLYRRYFGQDALPATVQAALDQYVAACVSAGDSQSADLDWDPSGARQVLSDALRARHSSLKAEIKRIYDDYRESPREREAWAIGELARREAERLRLPAAQAERAGPAAVESFRVKRLTELGERGIENLLSRHIPIGDHPFLQEDAFDRFTELMIEKLADLPDMTRELSRLRSLERSFADVSRVYHSLVEGIAGQSGCPVVELVNQAGMEHLKGIYDRYHRLSEQIDELRDMLEPEMERRARAIAEAFNEFGGGINLPAVNIELKPDHVMARHNASGLYFGRAAEIWLPWTQSSGPLDMFALSTAYHEYIHHEQYSQVARLAIHELKAEGAGAEPTVRQLAERYFALTGRNEKGLGKDEKEQLKQFLKESLLAYRTMESTEDGRSQIETGLKRARALSESMRKERQREFPEIAQKRAVIADHLFRVEEGEPESPDWLETLKPVPLVTCLADVFTDPDLGRTLLGFPIDRIPPYFRHGEALNRIMNDFYMPTLRGEEPLLSEEDARELWTGVLANRLKELNLLEKLKDLKEYLGTTVELEAHFIADNYGEWFKKSIAGDEDEVNFSLTSFLR